MPCGRLCSLRVLLNDDTCEKTPVNTRGNVGFTRREFFFKEIPESPQGFNTHCFDIFHIYFRVYFFKIIREIQLF